MTPVPVAPRSPDDSPPVPPAPDPFPTLAILQARHTELVVELRAGANPDVVAFVARAVATGRVLEAADERAAAQGLIGYWTARLVTAEREDGPSGAADPRFSVLDTLLADFVPAALDPALAAADGHLADSSADHLALARRVLIRLVQLADDGTSTTTAVLRMSLNDLGPQAEVEAVLAGLADAGVIRRDVRADGVEEVRLRSETFLTRWKFLRELVDKRKELRTRAGEWAKGQTGERRKGVLRWVKRRLVSVGKRIDRGWEWVIRLFGVLQPSDPDPKAELPDVEFYRDLDPVETTYLFHRRKLAKEAQEWLRVVKALVLLGAFAALVGAGFILLVRHYDRQAINGEVNLKASQLEIDQRRARQRLKEHHNLVRLLAEYQQFNNSRDYPRARAARWRLETPLYADKKEKEEYRREWTTLGVEFTDMEMSETRENKEGDLRVKCTGDPLVIAENLRKLVQPRHIPPGKPGYDEEQYDQDTDSYLNFLKLVHYRATRKLVREITVALAGDDLVEENSNRIPTYNAVADLMHEFWILYRGEMVLVESVEVKELMIEFGKALVSVDWHFEKGLDAAVTAAGITDKTTIAGEPPYSYYWTTAAKSFAWQSKAKPDALVSARATFLRTPIRDLRAGGLPLVEHNAMKTAIHDLNTAKKALDKMLEEEVNNIPPPPPPRQLRPD